MTSCLMDASSAIHGWDEYPVTVFPDLWAWVRMRIEGQDILIVKDNLTEIKRNNPECHAWFKEANIEVVIPDNAIAQTARLLADQLGIANDNWRSGVNYEDLLLLAAACVRRCDVITNEARQPNPPRNLANYKIPAVGDRICDPKVQTYPFREWFVDRGGNRPLAGH